MLIFFHYMLCKNIYKNLPKFGTWQNLIKECVEVYGHLYWMARINVLIRKKKFNKFYVDKWQLMIG